MGYHFGPRADKIRQEGNTPRMPALLQNSVAVGVLIHNMMAFQHGMQVVMMAKYDFETLTRYNAQYGLSVFFLAPSIWNRIVNEWRIEECQNIRWAMSGGSPLSFVLQKRVNSALKAGTYLLPNWGMTELVCGATQMDPEEVDEEGSVGRLVPRMEAMVIGDLGQSLPSGQSGELVVKGKCHAPDKWGISSLYKVQTSCEDTTRTLRRQTERLLHLDGFAPETKQQSVRMGRFSLKVDTR